VKRHDDRRDGNGRTALRAVLLAALLAGLTVATGAAAARAADGGFAAVERQVLGAEASADWHHVVAARAAGAADDVPGRVPDEFGTGRRSGDQERDAAPPGRLGRQFKAGLLSAVLPGAGQFYNGHRQKAWLMAGVEAGIWTTYFVFDHRGDSRMASSREWAGIYAGTEGEHDDNYWQSLSLFLDSDAYNDSRYREARALQEPVSGLVGADDAWQWVNNDRRYGYAKLRADGNSSYDRRDFMILFAVLNRAVSVFDAVMGAGRFADATHARVLGLDVDVRMQMALSDPGARCVVSRRF
jgi:hypothetical protein